MRVRGPTVNDWTFLPDQVKEGCELCGDFPVEFRGRCHPSAPVRIEMDEFRILSVFCFVPDCNKLITRLPVQFDHDG